MVLKVLFGGVCCLLLVGWIESRTTIYPEICRIMGKYQSCTDRSYRIACPSQCNASCNENGFTYFPSMGMCFAGTKSHSSLWMYTYEFCGAYNGELAVVKTATDREVIKELFEVINQSTQQDIHVGTSNINLASEWIYADMTAYPTGDAVYDSYWDSGYPTSSSSKSLCMNLKTISGYKQRNDDCNQNFGYACQAEPTIN